MASSDRNNAEETFTGDAAHMLRPTRGESCLSRGSLSSRSSSSSSSEVWLDPRVAPKLRLDAMAKKIDMKKLAQNGEREGRANRRRTLEKGVVPPPEDKEERASCQGPCQVQGNEQGGDIYYSPLRGDLGQYLGLSWGTTPPSCSSD
ncbi:hypothetical protein Acr_00g0028450 [Actinidia rufa]|uniref:Uncharacterized protein n=1 Tax=Actinidia rufa TaxID=165716 RepID=A0A7J0DG61_9ERIC|nr:hypothetical protein Acr_00g0028450 [Actinidia rufa]